MKRMLAEFEKIQAILMAFPHEFGDWAYCIKEARESFLNIIQTIAKHAKVLVCVHTSDTIGYETLKNLPGVEIAKVDTNDTWARDFGAKSLPLTRTTIPLWGLNSNTEGSSVFELCVRLLSTHKPSFKGVAKCCVYEF
ncbi:hypothetical protein VN0410_07500 [Helicobacter pylori]|nr:hypothetical protein VN0410_07500 [Helicobacter pylori]